jgi:hypothetical protein
VERKHFPSSDGCRVNLLNAVGFHQVDDAQENHFARSLE